MDPCVELMRLSLLRSRLNEIAVFECAARAGSFSAAGRELGMTQSAVSHHIAALEADMGVRLFDRIWRGVVLTDAGTQLFGSARLGLDTLAKGMDDARAAGRRAQLTILTDFAFAAFWLIPRLADLRHVVGGADVQVVTTQEAHFPAGGVVHVAVLFGTQAPEGWTSVRLVDEWVAPIASPALAAEIGTGGAAAFADAPLLHLESERADAWLTWRSYLERLDAPTVRRAADFTFNNYPLLVQAAIGGQGVALGWRSLSDDLVRRGLVTPVGPAVHVPERGYDMMVPDRSPHPVPVAALQAWMIEAFTEPARAGAAADG